MPVASALFPRVSSALNEWAPGLGYDSVFAVYVVASFAVSWLMALLSWHLFEKRILALKRFFSYGPADAGAAFPSADRSAVNTPRR